jgi:polyhydroxybutyrate depolymerase
VEKLKFTLTCFFCVLSLLFSIQNCLSAQDAISDSLVWQDRQRKFVVYLPSDYQPTKSYPIVFSLHPGLSNAANHASNAKWHLVGDTAQFITVYPEGVRTSPTSQGGLWNAYNQPSSVASVDDVGFLNLLLDSMFHRYSVDTCRVYLSGFSNGTMMIYRMACDFTNRFAAIAPLSGGWGYGVDGFCGDGNCDGDVLPNCTWEMAQVNCQPQRKIPVIFMKGSLEGDNLPTCRGSVDSVNRVYWSNFLMCQQNIVDTFVAANKTVIRERFSNCADSSEFQFLTVVGNSHIWHQPATALFWQFLKTKSSCNATTTFTPALIDQKKVAISPNPGSEVLLIQVPSHLTPAHLQVFDGSGQLSMEQNYASNSLNIIALKAGFYFLKVQFTDGTSSVVKFIKI